MLITGTIIADEQMLYVDIIYFLLLVIRFKLHHTFEVTQQNFY
jgi:hypothetical protein